MGVIWKRETLGGGPRFFLAARFVFMLAAPAPFLFGFAPGTTDAQRILYAVGLAIIELGGVVVFAKWDGGAGLTGGLLDLLSAADLVGLGMMALVASDAVPDPLYPAFLGLPVLYALLVRKSTAVQIGLTACFVYIVASFGQQSWEYYSLLVYVQKVVCIPAVTWVVAIAAELQHRRVRQLQLIANMAETLHTPLDSEFLPQETVERLAVLLGLARWRLCLVDADTREILFEARAGEEVPAEIRTAGAGVRGRLGGPERRLEPDESLAHTLVLANEDTEAVFCAPRGEFEGLAAEERMVLEAVSRELLVAVENRRLFGLTKRESVTDALTGLYNRRHLSARTVEEIGRCRRFGNPVSLLMIDGDDFKHVNDVHGHGVGDQVLAELAQLMVASVREVDVVARYGGEEFCLLLPETDAEGASRLAEKLCETVRTHPFVSGVELSISIGVATFPESADSAESLHRAADNALYAAKTGGKSRVCIHEQRVDFAS